MTEYQMEMRLLHLNSERAISIKPHECAAIVEKLKVFRTEALNMGFKRVAANAARLIMYTERASYEKSI